MVDRIGFEPICCPVCQTGDHPKQSHSPNINHDGGQGGIRTHKTLILSQVSIPVPSPGHMCGFCLLAPQTRSTYAFLGVHTRQQHHWTTRISGWVVVIISPVYSLAPHSGPNLLSEPRFLAVNFLAPLTNCTALFRRFFKV